MMHYYTPWGVYPYIGSCYMEGLWTSLPPIKETNHDHQQIKHQHADLAPTHEEEDGSGCPKER